MSFEQPTLSKPGRYMDAVVCLVLNGKDPHSCDSGALRFVDGDWQPHMGYPIGHISPLKYSTHDGDSMEVFQWMSERGIVTLSNGDGDSYDCDWLPQCPKFAIGEYTTAFIRAMDGYNCESFAHAICLALLVGTRTIEVDGA